MSADVLFDIQREASLAGFAHIFPPDRYPFPDDEVRAALEETLGRDGVRVFLDPEQRGFALVEGAWLQRLFVRPAHWGTGVAVELHESAVGAGARVLWVLEENTRARRFYEKHGWRVDGRTRVVPFPPHPMSLGYSYRG